MVTRDEDVVAVHSKMTSGLAPGRNEMPRQEIFSETPQEIPPRTKKS